MNILNAEPLGYSEQAIRQWKENGHNYMASGWKEIDDKPVFPEVDLLIVRLGRKIDNAILQKFPALTHLLSATTGLDHIDLPALAARNIKLVSLRGEDAFLQTIPSTAEHTWALLLALVRHIPAANEDVRKGNWNRDAFRGRQLKGKTIGIIGMGRTGTKVAKYATVFGMQVLYVDPNVDHPVYNKCAGLEELLPASDVISLHVHLNDSTTHLLHAGNIPLIKNGSLLINTSRGKLIDEAAVLEAYRAGKIAGIATDVLATELSGIQESALWQAQQQESRIIITPHLGGATSDAMWACEEYLVNKVLSAGKC